MEWFSAPQETIEAAQALFEPDLFRIAAVFKTPDNKFVMAELRAAVDWPPHKAAVEIEQLTGNKMIGVCDPLLGVWMEL